MTWILTICTAGWVMCSSLREFEYPTESQCYSAITELYKHNDKDDFNYVICSPKREGEKK